MVWKTENSFFFLRQFRWGPQLSRVIYFFSSLSLFYLSFFQRTIDHLSFCYSLSLFLDQVHRRTPNVLRHHEQTLT